MNDKQKLVVIICISLVAASFFGFFFSWLKSYHDAGIYQCFVDAQAFDSNYLLTKGHEPVQICFSERTNISFSRVCRICVFSGTDIVRNGTNNTYLFE